MFMSCATCVSCLLRPFVFTYLGYWNLAKGGLQLLGVVVSFETEVVWGTLGALCFTRENGFLHITGAPQRKSTSLGTMHTICEEKRPVHRGRGHFGAARLPGNPPTHPG